MPTFIRFAAVSVPLILMACTADTRETIASQEEVCTAAVAAASGQASGDLTATLRRSDPGGNTIVQVDGPAATYECELDANLTVVDVRGGGLAETPGG